MRSIGHYSASVTLFEIYKVRTAPHSVETKERATRMGIGSPVLWPLNPLRLSDINTEARLQKGSVAGDRPAT